VRRQDTWVAVYRREATVWRQDVDRAGHGLLSDLFRWFRGWMSAGIFRSIEIG
jgi:hypothetical protein